MLYFSIFSLDNDAKKALKRWQYIFSMMWSFLFTLLFLWKVKFTRNTSFYNYLKEKYGQATLKTLRSFESNRLKTQKAYLDLDFLLYCKSNNVTPKFIHFKLYRRSLYNSDLYRDTTAKLLDLEINFKNRRINSLNSDINKCKDTLQNKLSFLDFQMANFKIGKTLSQTRQKCLTVQWKKLSDLGIQRSNFMSPDDVVFNFSDHHLSQKEKFLLSLGLDFKLPNFRPNHLKLFIPFEKFISGVNKLFKDKSHYDVFRSRLQDLLNKTESNLRKTNWLPFFKKDDLQTLKQLSKNEKLVICRPDKGRGVVILNKSDYISKMNNILSDSSKFVKVNEPLQKVAFRTEDKLNRLLNKLKNSGLIENSLYQSLHSTGSTVGTLYGLPKVHKGAHVPLRPIMAAYNLPNAKLAKFLANLLTPIMSNEFTISNSFEFCKGLKNLNPHSFMVSYDIESLFTNIPVFETINVILNKLFTNNSMFHGFDRGTFRDLLEICVCDTHFIFNNVIYKQIEGVAMGSSLGPVFANIFMCNMEESFLSSCSSSTKPIYYKRYVDDIFACFNSSDVAESFLSFINSKHPNIRFTLEKENNNKLPFLDVLIEKHDHKIETNVYRKKTFTGLTTNFYSCTPTKYKIAAIQTLIHRAYKICSTWEKFHLEINALMDTFSKNGYPRKLIHKLINNYLTNIFKPRIPLTTVPKDIKYLSMPFLGHLQQKFNSDLKKLLSQFLPFIDLRIAPNNSLSLSSIFKFKDSMPLDMRSGIVYSYNCSKCNLECAYIGCTERLLRVRVASHLGISSRTGIDLKVKEKSNIRLHNDKCKNNIDFKDFKILYSSKDKQSLLIAESILIKQLRPKLNSDTTSIPLHLA